MRVFVDDGAVAAASADAAGHAATCRALVVDVSGLGSVADPGVRTGFTELADVCADVLELVAIDLDLVAARMSAGARLYSLVEGATAAALQCQRP